MATDTNTTLTDDARRLYDLREREAKAKEAYEEAKSERERLEERLLARMADEGCEGVKADGLNFVPAETVYGQVQDREKFIAWAKENEPELLEVRERKRLINQLVRERIDNGEPLPPGLGHYPRSYISIRSS